MNESTTAPTPNLPESVVTDEELCRLFTLGYRSGHNDTVESQYIDVVNSEVATYFMETVAEFLAELPPRSEADATYWKGRHGDLLKLVETLQSDLRAANARADGVEADADRYRHLRAGKRNGSSAPFVQNPRKSVLYAIQSYTGESLDLAVDEDILDVEASRLHIEGELVESGYTGEPWPSNEHCAALYELTRQRLGWSLERFNAAFVPEEDAAQAVRSEASEGEGS